MQTQPKMLIEQISSDIVVDTAYQWLCQQRLNYSHNSDIWSLRWDWTTIKPDIQKKLRAGEYQFGPLTEYRFPDQIVQIWQADDALVLKALTLVLTEYWAPVLSKRCFHLKGQGGLKAAVRETYAHLQTAPQAHVMKSDIKGYYANINHEVLYQLSEQHLPNEKPVLRLILQYLKRTHTYGGLYQSMERGIVLACPLSPLMGALYLKPLDDIVAASGLFYARYMDDWVVIAPTRWKIRRAIRQVNQTLNRLLVEKHPAKTFIGRAEKGFDFLGYFLSPTRIRASHKTLIRCLHRLEQLNQQGADEQQLVEYLQHWWCWLHAGIFVPSSPCASE